MINASCAIILDDNNNILSVSRKDDHNDWGLPGGKLDPNESFTQALIREVLEETGYSCEIIDSKNYFEIEDDTALVRTYLARITSNTPININSCETGLVSYKTKKDLLSGSFKEYNKKCFLHFNL